MAKNTYYALISLIACAIPAYADVKDVFKQAVVGHQEAIEELAARIDYWQTRGSDAATLVEAEAKIIAYAKTTADIKKHAKEIKDYVATHKRPFLSAAQLIAQDPDIAALIKRKNFLEKTLLNTQVEQQLINTVYLPNAEKRHEKYVNSFGLFDIEWLKRHKRIQTRTRKKLVAGFNNLYNLRKPDLQALRQGYVLNPRTPQEQIEKLETNRGIDPESRVTIERNGIKRDMSVEFFEQNNSGTPDTYIK